MVASHTYIVVRALSSSAVRNQMLIAPIRLFSLEGRYATALYSAAFKQKALDSVEKELVQFQQTLKTDVRLKEFVMDPTIQRLAKLQSIKQISTKLSLSPTSANFLELLAENGRLKKLDGMINAFKAIMAAHRGDVQCLITTAKPLDDASKKELEDVLKGFVKKGENIILNMKVDPAIIGGMIVSIGDKYVDMSTSSKIKKYTDIIKAAA